MKRLLFLLALLLLASPAAADVTVVTTCGTAPTTLKAGQVLPGSFVDINGNTCTSSGSGGGVAANVVTNSSTSSVTTNWSTINNITLASGKGNGGSGSLNVYVASDQPPLPIAFSSSGTANTAAVGCDSHVFKHITSATDTVVVQGVSAKTIKICGALASFSGSAAQSIFLENTASANNNCSSSNTQITGLWTGNSSSPSTEGFYNPIWGGLSNTSGQGVCVNSSGTGGVDLDVWYTQGS